VSVEQIISKAARCVPVGIRETPRQSASRINLRAPITVKSMRHEVLELFREVEYFCFFSNPRL